MDKKRKDPPYASSITSDSKRFRSSTSGFDDDGSESSSKAPRPTVDPTYGQRGAFPELEADGDDALFFGPASDGLEYLRMVRSEAATVPTVLSAPPPPNQSSPVHAGYSEGSYADGAYTAAPVYSKGGDAFEVDDDDVDAQEAYYSSLLARFTNLSTSLQNPPGAERGSASTMSAAQDLSSGSNSKWRSMLNRRPSMALLGLLSHEPVLQGLHMLEIRLTVDHLIKTPSLGLWAWGLMARCRDAGQMSSEEIGILRDLGKKAIWLLHGIQAGSQQEHFTEGDPGDEGRVVGSEAVNNADQVSYLSGASGGANKARVAAIISNGSDVSVKDQLELGKILTQAQLPTGSGPAERSALGSTTPPAASLPSIPPADPRPPSGQESLGKRNDPTTKVQATLDMIITVVGEMYGQRDLLEGRLVWGE